MDIATYYTSSFLCGYSKAILERGIEGGYNFLSALIGSETCSEMNRTYEHFELLNLVTNDKFFVTFVDSPFKIETHTGEKFDWDAYFKKMKQYNEQLEYELQKWDINRTEYPQMTGACFCLYRVFYFNLSGGSNERFLKVDKKS